MKLFWVGLVVFGTLGIGMVLHRITRAPPHSVFSLPAFSLPVVLCCWTHDDLLMALGLPWWRSRAIAALFAN